MMSLIALHTVRPLPVWGGFFFGFAVSFPSPAKKGGGGGNALEGWY